MVIKNVTFLLIILFFGQGAISQKWAIRPELLLTSTRAQFVSNTAPKNVYRPVYYNRPDFVMHVDLYNKKRNRWTFSIGTYSTGFGLAPNAKGGNGLLGFLFPTAAFSTSATSGGVILSGAYNQRITSKQHRSIWYVSAGLNGWMMRPSKEFNRGGGGDLDSIRSVTVNETTAGWMVGTHFVWKNKRHREVMQLSIKYNGSFGSTQEKITYYHEVIIPGNPPQVLGGQQLVHRLTGASIQIGFSKTLLFLPRQKKWTAAKSAFNANRY